MPRTSGPHPESEKFEEAAARLLRQDEPELTPELLRQARAVLDAPEAPLTPGALAVLYDVVVFVDSLAGQEDYPAVRGSIGDLTRLLRRHDLDPATRVNLQRLLAIDHTYLDQPDEAMAAALAAVDAARTVAGGDPAKRPDLAVLLSDLARLAQGYGRRAEAVTYGTEAVATWRALAAEHPPHRPTLAAALNNLAVALGDGGHTAEAVEHAAQAVAIYRELAADPGDLVPLALALRTLATAHSENGDRVQAVAPARDAVRVLRPLAAHDPGAARALADTLSSLSSFLAEIGEAEESRHTAQEAVRLARDLVEASRDDLPALGGALNNLANRLSATGARPEAVAADEEAVQIYRELARGDPGARPDLAMALNNLGSLLHDAGRYAQALERLQESLAIRRELARADTFHRPDLAHSLLNVANLLGDGGRLSEAAGLAAEAVEIRRAEARANPRLAGGLGNALDALAVLARQADDEATALAASTEAVATLRACAAGHRVFLPDLAKALTNYGAIARTTPEALNCLAEAVRLYRELADRSDTFRTDLASALDNLASALSEAGREPEAREPAREAVTIRRLLARADPTLEPDLSGALHNLANRLEDQGQAREPLELSVEILSLRGRTDATAAAVHRLLEVDLSARPPGAQAALAAALDRLGEIVPLALWTVDDPGDRRALRSVLAWMASAGAVHLALEERDPRRALEWIDQTITLDLRAGDALRAPEFAELARHRPDLAARLRRSLGGAAQPTAGGAGAAAATGSGPGEFIGDVISEIRRSGSAFDHFLQPRPADQIVAGLPGTTAVLAGGPRGSIMLVVEPGRSVTAVPLDIRFDDVASLAGMSLASRPLPVRVSHTRLRALVTGHVLPVLQELATRAGPVLVVPVGIMHWLPVQAVATLAGLPLGIIPTLARQQRERTWTGQALVVHSHGGGRRLDAGLEEARHVAELAGADPLTDPVDLAEVYRRLGSSPLVHFACHGLADPSDPESSGLQLGPRPQDRLTVRLLAEHLIADGAPCFVALSACQTGRTELAIPEEASSIANLFLGHGTRCVLSTLWNVDDGLARDFGAAFADRWRAGGSAGSAYALTLRALAADRAGDAAAFDTLDAFQLAGDGDLAWPLPPAHRP